MLDEVHRRFIKGALSGKRIKEKFSKKDMDDYYEAWKTRKNNQKDYSK